LRLVYRRKTPLKMKLNELKKALQSKLVELDVAMELGKPRKELLHLYKELKELQYRLLHAEVTQDTSENLI
jgi:hypothetical protein